MMRASTPSESPAKSPYHMAISVVRYPFELPKEMWLHIISQLPPDAVNRLGVASRSMQVLANDKHYWFSKYRYHFPHHYHCTTALPISRQHSDFKQAFKSSYQRDYHALSLRERRLFLWVKEANVSGLNGTLRLNVNDLYLKDHHQIPLIAWLVRTNNPIVLNICYRLVEQYYRSGNRVDVTKVDSQGNMLFHWAALLSRSTSTLGQLIQKGTGINSADCYRRLAFHWAKQFGRAAVELLLVKNDLNPLDSCLKVALHWTVKYGHAAMVAALLVKGADINGTDHYQWTALHWAAELGHANVVTELLAKGADMNLVDCRQSTPLHLAARKGHVDVVLLLLATSINTQAIDSDGNTALDLAKSDTVVTLLKKASNHRKKVHYPDSMTLFKERTNPSAAENNKKITLADHRGNRHDTQRG